jgi:hypothetical protein
MAGERGGVEAAHFLIQAAKVSDGYTELYERRRLDLTVEALVLENSEYHALFSVQELQICRKRLVEYGYMK